MTKILTASEVNATLSRFLCKRETSSIPGTYTHAGHTYNNSWRVSYHYTCKMCPDEEKFTVTSTNSRLYALRWDLSRPEHKADHDLIFSMYSHLVEEHNVLPCEICGELITKRGMTRHQKAPDCQGELRRHSMLEKGYARLDWRAAKAIPDIMRYKLSVMESLAPWNDENVLFNLERAASEAQHQLLSSLEVRPCYTNWDRKERKYLKEYWAPPLTANFLETLLVSIKGTDDDRILDTINQWIDSDDNMRDAILGILELQKEGFT